MSLTNIDNLLQTIEASDVPAGAEYNEPSAQPLEAPTHEDAPPLDTDDTKPISSEPIEHATSSEDSVTTDDYGTTVSKKERTYTEAEVQQMMRDRNARGEYARLEAERVAQLQQSRPEAQQELTEDWEAQLESFVEQTLSKREQKFQEHQWQQQQQQQQAQFEAKFNTGAAKYADFEQVVQGKPLTPQMVIATRGMSDPAAFIYAAAKTQEAELGRISKITDPYAQAVEIGKLEERMKKARQATSNAPKPLASQKGDSIDKARPRSIDDILRQEDARRLQSRR